jgi:hypothetical protein
MRADKTSADPIVNDPKADTISVKDLADIERVAGRVGALECGVCIVAI